MTVRDILIIACDMSGNSDVALKLISNKEFTEEEQNFINELTKCFNFIQNEICTEYIPTIHKEKIVSVDGKFSIANLSKKLAYIISIKDNDGKNVRYGIYGGELLFEGEVVIEYCYSPENLSVEDESIMILPDRIVAYGVLREYYLLQDFASEASMFEERFKNSLANFCRKHTEIVMPKRFWA